MKKSIVFLVIIFLLVTMGFSQFSHEIYTELIGTSQFLDENGDLTGSCVEIFQEIQKRVGDDTEIKVVPWARGYNAIQTQDNVILFATTLTEERRSMFQWVGSIFKQTWAFYTKKDSGVEISSLEDAKKLKRIGTYRADAREQFLQSEGFENLDSNVNNINNVKKLHANRVDAVIDSPSSFYKACEEAGFDKADFVEAFIVKETNLFVTFSKNFDEALFLQYQNALKTMYDDGTMETIYKKWYPDSSMPKFTIVE